MGGKRSALVAGRNLLQRRHSGKRSDQQQISSAANGVQLRECCVVFLSCACSSASEGRKGFHQLKHRCDVHYARKAQDVECNKATTLRAWVPKEFIRSRLVEAVKHVRPFPGQQRGFWSVLKGRDPGYDRSELQLAERSPWRLLHALLQEIPTSDVPSAESGASGAVGMQVSMKHTLR